MSGSQIHPDGITLTDVLVLNQGGVDYETRIENLRDELGQSIQVLFNNVTGDPGSNVALKAVFDNFTSLINTANDEITRLHKLIGQLTFELTEQGVKIEDQELINEIEVYIK